LLFSALSVNSVFDFPFEFAPFQLLLFWCDCPGWGRRGR